MDYVTPAAAVTMIGHRVRAARNLGGRPLGLIWRRQLAVTPACLRDASYDVFDPVELAPAEAIDPRILFVRCLRPSRWNAGEVLEFEVWGDAAGVRVIGLTGATS